MKLLQLKLLKKKTTEEKEQSTNIQIENDTVDEKEQTTIISTTILNIQIGETK